MTGALFLAVEPDDETRSLLAQMLAPFGSGERPTPLPGRLSPPKNWHITVRFLGMPDEVAVDRLMAELDQADLASAFPITLSGFGAFPNQRNATVLWVGVESESLIQLAADVEEIAVGVGIEPDDRPYVPHLTLSRIRPPVDLTDLVADDWGRLRFSAERLTLFRSERADPATRSRDRSGVRYVPVESFPL